MTTTLTITIDLGFLAGEVNDAHRQVTFHAKGMLLEAKRAGEALIEAKKLCKHGEFKAWVEANCRCSYATAAEYMRVARVASTKNLDLQMFDGGVRAFLDASRDRENAKPQAEKSTFTKDDAEYVLKINALAERGATDGERDVACRKLDAIAQQFDMSGEEVVVAAKKLKPEPVALSPLEEGLMKVVAPFRKKPKDELIDLILTCICTHPDLIEVLRPDLKK